jgi:hypothetical protein
MGVLTVSHLRTSPNPFSTLRRDPRTRFQSRLNIRCLPRRLSDKVQSRQEGYDERTRICKESSARWFKDKVGWYRCAGRIRPRWFQDLTEDGRGGQETTCSSGSSDCGERTSGCCQRCKGQSSSNPQINTNWTCRRPEIKTEITTLHALYAREISFATPYRPRTTTSE